MDDSANWYPTENDVLLPASDTVLNVDRDEQTADLMPIDYTGKNSSSSGMEICIDSESEVSSSEGLNELPTDTKFPELCNEQADIDSMEYYETEQSSLETTVNIMRQDVFALLTEIKCLQEKAKEKKESK